MLDLTLGKRSQGKKKKFFFFYSNQAESTLFLVASLEPSSGSQISNKVNSSDRVRSIPYLLLLLLNEKDNLF